LEYLKGGIKTSLLLWLKLSLIKSFFCFFLFHNEKKQDFVCFVVVKVLKCEKKSSPSFKEKFLIHSFHREEASQSESLIF